MPSYGLAEINDHKVLVAARICKGNFVVSSFEPVFAQSDIFCQLGRPSIPRI